MTTTAQIVARFTGTAAEIHAQLSATTTVPSGRGRLTHAWVSKNIDPEVAATISVRIKDVDPDMHMRFVLGTASETGIDTTAVLWKQRATGLAQLDASLAPHLVLLRDFESTQVTQWEISNGTGEIPSVETIQSILDAAATKAWWAAKSAVVEEGLHGLTITSKAQVRDVIGGD